VRIDLPEALKDFASNLHRKLQRERIFGYLERGNDGDYAPPQGRGIRGSFEIRYPWAADFEERGVAIGAEEESFRSRRSAPPSTSRDIATC
jgi:hypothetical protein